MAVVMLSGPVAAGKTTIARELIEISSAPLCYLEGDLFWSLFAKPDPAPRRERFRLDCEPVLGRCGTQDRHGILCRDSCCKGCHLTLTQVLRDAQEGFA